MLERGVTQFLTSFQDEVKNPQWRGSYSHEMCFGRGYFITTPDSGPSGEEYPIVIELNPNIDAQRRDALKRGYEEIGVIVVIPEPQDFHIEPFDETYLQALLSWK